MPANATWVNNIQVQSFRIDLAITYNSNTLILVNGASGIEIDQIFPTNTVTGMMLQAGSYDQQRLYLLNNTNGSIVFDISANSLVADGVSDSIAAHTLALFIWSSNLGLWFRAK